MPTQTATADRPKQDLAVEQKIQKLRELYADAPELGRVALENGLSAFKQELGAATGQESAGRIGARQGKVSELTVIVPFATGGAKRLRGLLELLQGNFQGADAVGTVHDMRFVFLDNDTKLLFATAYDGEWDAYIDDFATKIPDAMDVLSLQCDGLAGDSEPEGEGLDRRAPDLRGGLVRRQRPDSGGDATAQARRQGGRGIPRQDWVARASR